MLLVQSCTDVLLFTMFSILPCAGQAILSLWCRRQNQEQWAKAAVYCFILPQGCSLVLQSLLSLSVKININPDSLFSELAFDQL